MPKVEVFNAGHSARGLIGVNGRAVLIQVGEARSIDLPQREIDRIRGSSSETLSIVENESFYSPELRQLTNILSRVDEDPYDSILSTLNEIMGVDARAVRPSRSAMRDRVMGRVRDIISPPPAKEVEGLAEALRGPVAPVASETVEVVPPAEFPPPVTDHEPRRPTAKDFRRARVRTR